MTSAWNKGHTKDSHSSVLKISQTMRDKKLDNFAKWRERMKKNGKIKSTYPPLKKNGDLAELIGVILGDGHLSKYPRTESLRIVSNSNNPEFVKRYSLIIEKVFGKKPAIYTRKTTNAMDIRIYEKFISKRLSVPLGSKKDIEFTVPAWILNKKSFIVRFLRGLYEAEGSFNVHKATYTYKFIFSNRNKSLLDVVLMLWRRLGFNPHKSKDKIQLSRKQEVLKAVELLGFRRY